MDSSGHQLCGHGLRASLIMRRPAGSVAAVVAIAAGVVVAAFFAAGLLLSDVAWASNAAEGVQDAAATTSGAAGESAGSSGPEFRVWPVVLAVVLFVGVGLIAKFGKKK
ncbi:MAG: hypothetical protein IJ131_00780 [Eggerthellaceae bacterium]|nr:hypothetical protein [Eggerthellaceae bacterium]